MLGATIGYFKLRGDKYPERAVCEERHQGINKSLEKLGEMAETLARIDERTKRLMRTNGLDE